MLNLKWEDIEIYDLFFEGKLDFNKFMESIDEKFNEKLKDLNMEFELVDETIEVGNEDWKEEDGYIFTEDDDISISFPMEFDVLKSEYHTQEELEKLVDSVNIKLKESIKESVTGLRFDYHICFVKEYLEE